MDEKSLPQRERNIIEHLGEVWQLPHEISADTIKNITKLLMPLQESYRTIGLQAIADHVVSTINLHMLALMASVQQGVEAAEISAKEANMTLKQVSSTIFQTIDQLGKHLSVSSLDDLATLSNILISLQTLSQPESVQEAQSWLYELPITCYQQLTQEQLIIEPESNSRGIILTTEMTDTSISFQNWIHSTYPESGGTMIFVSNDQVHVSVPSSFQEKKTPSYISTWHKQALSNLALTA